MCGLAGTISQNKKIDKGIVERMLHRLHHRGPDGDGIFVRDGLVLGHKRLKIIDLTDKARQPMSIDQGRIVVSYNGEIYNHRDLRQEIGEVGWKSSSDTETLIQAYNKWNIDFLSRLNGMWSFALWDERVKTLFLSRDRFGIKPLYYAVHGGTLYFASEIKAFFETPVPIEPDYKTIGSFLRRGVIEHSPETWFKNIHAVPPGSYLEWSGGDIKITKYYHLPDFIDEENPIGLEQATRLATELITDSIARRTYADRKVGVHFSGGIDSSVVATKAAQSLFGKIDTYTYGYEEERYSEIPFAKNVSRLLSVENHESILTNEELDTLLVKTLIEQDEPYTSIRICSEHKLYADYKESGATVILEAAGGDEVSAGYSGYLWPWYLDSVLSHGPQRAMRDFTSISSNISEKDNFTTFLMGSAANYTSPGVCTSDGMPFLDPGLLSPSLTNLAPPVQFDRPFKSNLRNSQYIDFNYIKLPRFLRYLDRASMASSREARVPLLDHRVVELGFSAANEAKINHEHQRCFMKGVASDTLPSDYMPNKRSVVDPQRDWLRAGRLADMTRDTFHSKAFRERGLYNHKKVIQEYEKYESSDVPMNSFGLFQLLMTETWFEHII